MAFKVKGAASPAPAPTPEPTPATPTARVRVVAKPLAAATVAPAIAPTATPVAPSTPAQPAGIARARDRAAAVPETPPAVAALSSDAPLESWTHSGDEAAALAAAEAAKREAAKQARRDKGYWPIRFGLIAPSADYPDRYQADIILLDAKPGPAYFEHVLKNQRSGYWDVIEPCPKEFDSCPLCPPNGERDSNFVMLLSALNINGYTYTKGERAGTHVPITKELVVPWMNDHAFFHQLYKEHGTLRGIQLTMTRASKTDPQIGKPTFVGIFTDDQIADYIKTNGLWSPKITKEGEKIADEDWMMHAFQYAEFMHRPSGADLRARYSGAAGGAAPVGARTNDHEWGQSRYAPGAAGLPATGAGFVPGSAGRTMDDLDDDVPF